MKTLRYLPNVLTLCRILLCPFTLFYLTQGKFPLALTLFAVSLFTDSLDGFLARRLRATSVLGSFLDPMADKLTILGFFLVLLFLGLSPNWFVGLYIAVGLLLSIGLFFFESPTSHLQKDFTPLWIGRWNTAFQLGWIGYLLVTLMIYKGNVPTFLAFVNPVAYSILAFSQVVVFLCYFFHYRVHLTPEVRTFFPLHSSG